MMLSWQWESLSIYVLATFIYGSIHAGDYTGEYPVEELKGH